MPDIFEFDGNASGAISSINKLNSSLTNLNEKMELVHKTTEEGSTVTENLIRTEKRQIDASSQLITIYREEDGVLKKISEELKIDEKARQRQAAAVERQVTAHKEWLRSMKQEEIQQARLRNIGATKQSENRYSIEAQQLKEHYKQLERRSAIEERLTKQRHEAARAANQVATAENAVTNSFESQRLRDHYTRLEKTSAANYERAKAVNVARTAMVDQNPELERLNNHYRNLEKRQQAVTKSTKDLVISWKSFVKLVGVQLVHRGISQAMRAIEEGLSRSLQLQKSIAELQTISQNQPLIMSQWAEGLREVSGAWGLDILDNAEAAYQTLSNQVAEGAETFNFLGEAAQFAVTSQSTLADSVNLLTAAINSYKKDVIDADEISAQFFKTIELGRVRASEMANTFGDVSILASQLGIDLTELQAAISTLTIQGIKYNKAATQLRGIIVKLLKPSSEMKKFFKEIGVISGEAAIKTFGFGEVIAKMQEYTKGSSTEMAKLVTRIRGLSGQLAFAGEGLETYRDNLYETQNAQESYAKATGLVMDKPAKQLEQSIERIKNFFLVEIGQNITESLAAVNADFVDFETAVRALAKTIAAVLPAAIAAGLFALGTFGLAVTAIVAGIGALIYAVEALEREEREKLQRTLQAIEDNYKHRIKMANEYYKQERALIDYNNKVILQKHAELRRELFKIIDEQDSKIEDSFVVMAEGYEGVLSIMRQEIAGLRTEVERLENASKSAAQFVDSLREQQRQTQLEADLAGLDAPGKVERIDKEIADVRGKRQQALENQDIQKAIQYQNELISLIERKGKIQEESNERYRKAQEELAKREAEQAELLAQERRLKGAVGAEDELAEVQRKIKIGASEIAQLRERIANTSRVDLDIEKEKKKVIEEGIEVFKEAGTEAEKNKNIQQKALEEQQKLQEAYSKAQDTFKDFDLSIEGLSQEDARAKIRAFEEAYNAAVLAARKAGAEQETINELADSYFARSDKAWAEYKVARIKESEEVLNTKQKEYDALEKREKELRQIEQRRLTDRAKAIAQFRSDTGEGLLNRALERTEIRRNDVLSPTTDVAKAIEAYSQLRDFGKKIEEEWAGTPDISAKGERIRKAAESVLEILYDQNEAIATQEESILEIERKRLAVKKKLLEIQERMKGTKTGITPQYNATGGLAFGNDTVNTMLSPGEFVVNRDATSRFYSQLQSINSLGRIGSRGNTTNVGDVNINYHSTGSQAVDVVAIGNALSREIRRGRVSL